MLTSLDYFLYFARAVMYLLTTFFVWSVVWYLREERKHFKPLPIAMLLMFMAVGGFNAVSAIINLVSIGWIGSPEAFVVLRHALTVPLAIELLMSVIAFYLVCLRRPNHE